jgi:hypothetical protein
MTPLLIARYTRASALALLISTLCLTPSRSHTEEFGLSGNKVRFVDEPVSFGPAPHALDDSIHLGGFNRGPLNLSLTLSPQVSTELIEGKEQTTGGAMLRLAANSGDTPEDGSWFLFAGARGHAVSWDMASSFSLDDFVQLKQRETIGDFQMGVGYQMAGAQMSLGLKHQTYKIETNTHALGDWKTRQTSAGVSIAWRR